MAARWTAADGRAWQLPHPCGDPRGLAGRGSGWWATQCPARAPGRGLAPLGASPHRSDAPKARGAYRPQATAGAGPGLTTPGPEPVDMPLAQEARAPLAGGDEDLRAVHERGSAG